MKRRLVWIGCLLAALICSVIVFRRMDAMQFNGLRVMSPERLEQMTEHLDEMSGPENVAELITLDGEAIPYDVQSNTFYVSQSVEKENYAGTFAAARADCRVYIQSDIALYDKRAAVAEGHIFHLWFVTQSAYSVSDFIFTGLPMISISSDQGRLSEHYERGNIIVHNPNDQDVITMSVKYSDLEVKTNYNSGTISFQLYKKGYQEERNLQMLGLGKRTSWKLYPVYDEDGALVREMLAAYVWNCVCDNENMLRNMEYAEVIVDGTYRGLYYLSPKVGKGYLKLGEDDKAYKMEGQAEDGTKICETVGEQDTDADRTACRLYENLWEEEGRDLTSVNAGNMINYHIWLQAVCGVRNSLEDYYLIAYRNGDAYEFNRMPDRSKYVFGIYPAVIGWQSLQAAEAVMEDEVFDSMVQAQGESICRAAADRWREVRSGGLDTEILLQYAYQCEKELTESGYIVRQADQEKHEAACRALRQFIRQRMEYLDGYFNWDVQ